MSDQPISSYEEAARKLVRMVIMKSVQSLENKVELEANASTNEGTEPPPPLPEWPTGDNFTNASTNEGTEPPPPLPEWPTGDNFTVEKGEESIDKLVKTWTIGHSWKHCVDYLYKRDDLHCYAVKFCEPTRRKPAPRTTASVYFYVLIHRKDLPVSVMYAIEGQRLTHDLANTTFHEIWLKNVIRNKLSIINSFNLSSIPKCQQ